MANSERGGAMGGVSQIIESAREAEQVALDAVKRFLDTVDSVFPDVSQDGPRRKIIDSAFKLTEQLVNTWAGAAEKITKVVGDALTEPKEK